ncbi:hypothetical protein K2173_022966 [Erythroxylum novogranatense]|uniref:Uncharacterized protein n=1 Tax=Erythroxylum novogranatense TaxID=1862640 RepID=A0AAV8T7S0_9ROSI|nr:hypothetical protein K2173_022966 [Erythroxylum novogranatense]
MGVKPVMVTGDNWRTAQAVAKELPSEAVVSHVLEASQLHEWIEGATTVGNPDTLLSTLVSHVLEASQLLLVKI